MKKLTNIIAPLLKKYRYRNKVDPFDLFKKIKINENEYLVDKGNILILPLRVSPTSNVFEGLVGYALKLRGYSVSALMCGQSIPACENVNQRQNFSIACSLCNYEQKRFSEAYGIQPFHYFEEIEKEKQNTLYELSKQVSINEIFSYVHDKVQIGKYVEGGVARYLLKSNIDLVKNEDLIRKYFLTCLMTVEATRNVLRKTNPKFVLTSHGIYSTWGAAMETCIADGFNVVVWGRGYVGQGNIVASHNASYLFDTITETSEYWENSLIDENIKNDLDIYFYNKRNPNSGIDYINYYDDIKKETLDIFSKLGLDKNRHRIGVYPNIPWDGKMFSATEDFPDMNFFIKALLEWAEKNHQVDIIIRAHPAEASLHGEKSTETFLDLLRMECSQLPENIKYIEPTSSISSYELSKICDVALMYASTLALEFAYAMHPVIQVGLNNISNKGIVFDAPTKKMMFEYLDKAINNELIINNNQQRRVVQYANYWINQRHIQEELVKLSRLTFQNYTFDNSKSLASGNYKTLDWFIDRCIDGKPFVWLPNA